MATYNGERFLQEQLDSLAAQTLLPCELVVGDDGSTDGTLEILERFAKRAPFPVRVRRNIENLGYGKNFISTAMHCSGDWIAFCDQDDRWLPQKLERIGAIAQRHHQVDWISTRDIIEDKRRIANIAFRMTRASSWLPNMSPVKIYAGHRVAFRRYYMDLPWQTVERFSGHRKYAHDSWMSALGWLVGRQYFSSERLTIFRRHPDAATFDGAPSELLPRCHLSGETSAAREFFLGQERFWRAIGFWCANAAREDESPIADRLSVADKKSEAVADWYQLRAVVHAPTASRVERIFALRTLVKHGAYNCAFGWLPLVKDAVASIS